MRSLKIDDQIEFHPKAFVRKRLFEMDEFYFNMYCIQPGQKNPLHRHPNSAEVLFFVEGRGEVIVGREKKKSRRARQSMCRSMRPMKSSTPARRT